MGRGEDGFARFGPEGCKKQLRGKNECKEYKKCLGNVCMYFVRDRRRGAKVSALAPGNEGQNDRTDRGWTPCSLSYVLRLEF